MTYIAIALIPFALSLFTLTDFEFQKSERLVFQLERQNGYYAPTAFISGVIAGEWIVMRIIPPVLVRNVSLPYLVSLLLLLLAFLYPLPCRLISELVCKVLFRQTIPYSQCCPIGRLHHPRDDKYWRGKERQS
jgi:hypothetical protein